MQFAFGKAEETNCKKNIKKGENILEIHIPEKETFAVTECINSINFAKEFFNLYFPEYNYNFFTCHSWLLGSTTTDYLNSESNIYKFANLFDILSYSEGDEVLRYIFKWNTTRKNISEFDTTTSLAHKIKKHALTDKPFKEGYGIIKK